MQKLFKKLHPSETLSLFCYAGILLGIWFSEDNDAVHFMFISFAVLLMASIWSLTRLKRVSLVFWPLYFFLGSSVWLLFDGVRSTSGPPAAIGLFLGVSMLGVIAIQFLCLLVFARKDFLKMLAFLVLSFSITMTLDKTFITIAEMGEKGSDYFLDQYADWRVLDW